MTRLIDADALSKLVSSTTLFIKDAEVFQQMINDAPTIEPSGDLISREEVIDHDREWIIGCIKHDGFIHTHRFDKANQIILDALEPSGDLISREDAIDAIFKVGHEHVEEKVVPLGAVTDYSDAIKALPSAEPIVIRSKTLMPTNDFKEWAKRIRETNPNAVVIPCDAEVVSAEAVEEAEEPDEAHWIPLPGSYIEEDPT